MRKIFFTSLAIILITLTACGGQVATEGTAAVANDSEGIESLIGAENAAEIMKNLENIETTEAFETTELSESTETLEEQKESIPAEAFDLSDVSPSEALRMVLLSEAPFYCMDSAVNEDADFQGYLNELTFGGVSIVTPQFTILDLDGDEVSEVVLAIEDYDGSVVLRYHEGKVFGYVLGYRSMYNLKVDGSSMQSNSAFEYYISKLFFIGDSICYAVNMERMENAVEIRYYLHDVPVDEKAWEVYYKAYEEKEDAEWYEFSKEAIAKYVVTDSEKIGLEASLNERQASLDSFSYLIEMTEGASIDNLVEYNKYAKKFYYSCIAEMNKIYELCEDKLSGAELVALEKAQHEWQEGIDLRLARDLYHSGQAYSVEELEDWGLYYTYGRKILTRAFHLVNLYYDCHFYD